MTCPKKCYHNICDMSQKDFVTPTLLTKVLPIDLIIIITDKVGVWFQEQQEQLKSLVNQLLPSEHQLQC